MQNVNPTFLEYGILAMSLVGIVLLMALRIMTTGEGLPIVLSIISYGVGSAKGAATVNAVLTSVQGTNAASTQAPMNKQGGNMLPVKNGTFRLDLVEDEWRLELTDNKGNTVTLVIENGYHVNSMLFDI